MIDSESQDPLQRSQSNVDTILASVASSDLYSALSGAPQLSSHTSPISAYPSAITSASLADLELDASTMFTPATEDSAIFDTLISGSGNLDANYGTSSTEAASQFVPQAGNNTKRKSPADGSQPDDSVVKREADAQAKVARKPGRKPIKEEDEDMPPTNRAAQRAFRERKEQHLRDLESKVTELTQTTEKDKQANSLLKNHIARLETELRAYRERSSTSSRQRPSLEPANYPAAAAVFGPGLGHTQQSTTSAAITYPFGSAIAPLSSTESSSRGRTPASDRAGSSDPCLTHGNSPAHSLTQSPIGLDIDAGLINTQHLDPVGYKLEDTGDLSPTATRKPSQPSWSPHDGTDSNGGISRVFRFNSESGSILSHADSTPSLSQFNAESSCNTSPETYAQDSPAKLPDTTEPVHSKPDLQSFSTQHNPSGLDWLVAQNNGQFDPLLFGDYRESQDAILGDGDFNNGFFNDALLYDADTSNLNLDALFTPATELPQDPRPTMLPSQALLAQVDAQQQGLLTSSDPNSRIGLNDPYFSDVMKCQRLRAKLESKGFMDGKFDIDNLCNELKAKATCDGYEPTWTKDQLDEHFNDLIES